MTTEFAIAIIEAYIDEVESGVITSRQLAIKVGNILIELVKNETPWAEGIANAFELAAEACYMVAPSDEGSQEWLYTVSDRYDDLRP